MRLEKCYINQCLNFLYDLIWATLWPKNVWIFSALSDPSPSHSIGQSYPPSPARKYSEMLLPQNISKGGQSRKYSQFYFQSYLFLQAANMHMRISESILKFTNPLYLCKWGRRPAGRRPHFNKNIGLRILKRGRYPHMHICCLQK